MGLQQGDGELFSYRINLHQRVRSDHPLRKVLQVVDFGFVREEVARFYGKNGNVSVDPVILVKMMFLLFFENIPSERELMRVLPERLDYLFFLGYGLEDAIPDHSVLSKARTRWGAEVFEQLFVRTVAACVEAGLVDGGKIHMDSSLIDAHASRDSVVEAGPELVAALREAYGRQESKLETFKEPAQSGGQQTSGKGPVNATRVSTTDPQAPLVRHDGGAARPRYKHHRVVDEACGVITAVETTGADVDDGTPLENLCTQHEATTGREVHTVVADKKYGTVENFIGCQRKGIRSHMGDLSASQRGSGRREGIFDTSEFDYHAEADHFVCPAGEILRPRRLHPHKHTYEYATRKGVCGGCPLRDQCTRSKSGRTLHRHRDQDLLDAGRKQSASRAARRDRRRRQHLIEASFADATNEHGFKRARWRGKSRVHVQNHLIAACQNIRILLRKPATPRTTAQAVRQRTWEIPVQRPPCACFYRPRRPWRFKSTI